MEDLRRRMSSVMHFELPPLPDNLVFDCHPGFASVSQQVDDWFIEKMQIVDDGQKKRIAECKIGLFACLMHPQGLKERLVFAGKHLWTLFMVDDVLESSSKEEIAELKSLVWDLANGTYEGDMEFQNRCFLLYEEIMTELRSEMSPAMFSRYLKIFRTYLEGVESEVQHTLVQYSVPTPTVYRFLRRDTGFMEVMACIMTEFCMGIQLQQSDIDSDDIREMVACINDHIVMVNDLLSFRKEYYEKPHYFSHNWVFVLFHHSSEKTSFQEIVFLLRDLIQEEEAKILGVQKRLINRAIANNDNELLKFAHAFPMSAAGHLRWSYVTGRYHGYNNTLLTGEMFHGTWLLHPQATIIMPLQNALKHPYLF